MNLKERLQLEQKEYIALGKDYSMERLKKANANDAADAKADQENQK